MTLLTGAIVLAMLATVVSLLFGVSAMATGHAVGHHTSDEWMHLRVGFQVAAVLLLLLALVLR